jgi:glycosyltransferase involved in cell wall biosynthesis
LTRTVFYVQATSEVGGSDIALYRLVSHLDRERWRPVVVLPRPGPLGPRLEAAGATVHISPMVQLRPTFQIGHQARYAAGFWPAVVRLARLMRRERAAVVHTNSLFSLHGAWAARLARVPHVWHVREIPDAPAAGIRTATTVALALSARVITMTEAVARMFSRRQRAGGRVRTIYDGLDVSQFNPRVSGERIRRELGLDPDAPVVGFVGRLDPWKGCDVFVRAAATVAAEHPRARFLVSGGSLPGYEEHAAGLERLAAELGIADRIQFTGWTYRLDDIPEVMAALDVFVHTSVRPEPFGLVLVEAMATERPVVGADGGGVPEVVEDGVTGLLAPPGDWKAVAAAISSLLADPEKARAMGRAGRERAVRCFEVGGYARQVEALYESVLGERR